MLKKSPAILVNSNAPGPYLKIIPNSTSLVKENVPLGRFIQVFSKMDFLGFVRFIGQHPLPEPEGRTGERDVT